MSLIFWLLCSRRSSSGGRLERTIAAAERKAITRRLDDGTPAHSFNTLMNELSTIVGNTCRAPEAAGDAGSFHITTEPNAKQRQAIELLQPITL